MRLQKGSTQCKYCCHQYSAPFILLCLQITKIWIQNYFPQKPVLVIFHSHTYLVHCNILVPKWSFLQHLLLIPFLKRFIPYNPFQIKEPLFHHQTDPYIFFSWLGCSFSSLQKSPEWDHRGTLPWHLAAWGSEGPGLNPTTNNLWLQVTKTIHKKVARIKGLLYY